MMDRITEETGPIAPELILCIPGPWKDRSDFLQQIITQEPKGRFMFAGMILADVTEQDHVPLEFTPADTRIPDAFEIAGQGRIPPEVIEQLRQHGSVVYLLFPPDLPGQQERILKFTQVIQQAGGIAVKLECAGVAQPWERWFSLLSGTLFDLYCAAVVLLGDERGYYSCGMHQFGLPECRVPLSLPADEAGELMNQFNFWQIAERPHLANGHTFSLIASSPHFRLLLEPDMRHEPDIPFHNPYGVWRLDQV
jgi:hypothetical protein